MFAISQRAFGKGDIAVIDMMEGLLSLCKLKFVGLTLFHVQL